ncbi:MAG: class I SAM-dependent methyltransferase [bacterium]|nr:class I SAM-dependent methyltransferase [bacterium]
MLIDELNKKQQTISNSDVDWSKHYDHFEIEMRSMYKTIAKPQNDSHFQMLKNNAKQFLNGDKVFCEIGFGAGLTLRYALGHFKKVFGLDISKRNVEYTSDELKKEGYKNYELYYSDLMKPDSRFEKKFDVISFVHGLEHFTADDYEIVFRNIKSYLTVNGIFTGALPYKNDYNFRMCPHCEEVFEIDGHVSSHDIDSLTRVFEKNGFEVLYINDFNMNYALKTGSTLQKIHRILLYKLFKRKFFTQIEYIVRQRK